VKSRHGQQVVEMTNGHTTTYEHKNTTHTAHQEDAAQIHTVPNAPQTTTPHTTGNRRRPWFQVTSVESELRNAK
jgi:hypothetical protein